MSAEAYVRFLNDLQLMYIVSTADLIVIYILVRSRSSESMTHDDRDILVSKGSGVQGSH